MVARSAEVSVRVSAPRWLHPSQPRGRVPAAAAVAFPAAVVAAEGVVAGKD